MKSILLLSFLLIHTLSISQNQNTKITLTNQGLKFYSVVLTIDTNTFSFSLKINDTLTLNSFNPDTSISIEYKITLYNKGNKFDLDLKEVYNQCLDLSIELLKCNIKWYKKIRFRRKIICDNLNVKYYGYINKTAIIFYQ